jgi:intein/homing endonuclease
MIRISADFNELSIDHSRVTLGGEHGPRNLEHLKEGERIIVYEENDFEVEGIVEIIFHDRHGRIWFAILDWDTQRDL